MSVVPRRKLVTVEVLVVVVVGSLLLFTAMVAETHKASTRTTTVAKDILEQICGWC